MSIPRSVFALLPFVLALPLGAAEITTNGTGGGPWSDPATWRGKAVPKAEDEVTIRKDVEGRRDRKKNLKPADPKDPVRDTCATGFEPGEPSSFGTPVNMAVVPAMGLFGPHVALGAEYPAPTGGLGYTRPLHRLSQTGSYRVELWVRTHAQVCPYPDGYSPHVQGSIIGDGKVSAADMAQGLLYYERTLGRWHKVAFTVKAPPTAGGMLTLSINHICGVVEVDGVSVRPVSDREHDSLANFLEGAPAP